MCRNLLPKKITAGTVLINARFLLLKTQSLSAAGGEEEGEEIRKTEGGSEEKQGNVGKTNTRTKKRVLRKFEWTKWFYLQIWGRCGKMRWCIGIKSAILLFVVVFMCERAVVVA